MDELNVKELCCTSSENESSDDDAGPSIKQTYAENPKTVTFEDNDERMENEQKRKRKHTKRELRKQHAINRERDRMALVMPDPVRDRERERDLIRLATKGVVQLFNAVTERQKELKGCLSTKKISRKRRMRGLSPENFNRKLAKPQNDKDGIPDTKENWQLKSRVKTEFEAESELDTSGIKTEPEDDTE